MDNSQHQAYTTDNSFVDDLTATVCTNNEEQNKIVLNVLQDLFVEYFKNVGLKVNLDKNEHLVLSTSPRIDRCFMGKSNDFAPKSYDFAPNLPH